MVQPCDYNWSTYCQMKQKQLEIWKKTPLSLSQLNDKDRAIYHGDGLLSMRWKIGSMLSDLMHVRSCPGILHWLLRNGWTTFFFPSGFCLVPFIKDFTSTLLYRLPDLPLKTHAYIVSQRHSLLNLSTFKSSGVNSLPSGGKAQLLIPASTDMPYLTLIPQFFPLYKLISLQHHRWQV